MIDEQRRLTNIKDVFINEERNLCTNGEYRSGRFSIQVFTLTRKLFLHAKKMGVAAILGQQVW